MARFLNTTRQTVARLRKKFDIEIMKESKDERNKKILYMYKIKGLTGYKISKSMKMSTAQVYKIIKADKNEKTLSSISI